MSYCVLIHDGSDHLGEGAIGRSSVLREDRPCYPSIKAGHDYWWLTDELHESLSCSYSLSYQRPYWIVEISDINQAVLFKLAWGTK
jgi:hypothetical protein